MTQIIIELFNIGHTESKKVLSIAELLLNRLKMCFVDAILNNKSLMNCQFELEKAPLFVSLAMT